MRVTRDSLSWAIGILGLILPALLITYSVTDFAIFGTLMFVWGFGMAGTVMLWTSNTSVTDDYSFDQKEVEKVSRYTIIAFLTMLVGSIAIPYLFTSMIPLASTGVTRLLYSWFFAINEETFFRGGLLFQVYNRYPSRILASFVSAAAFCIFHFAVYGTQVEALWFVFGAGAALSYAVLWSGRLTSSYISHILWNTVATVGSI